MGKYEAFEPITGTKMKEDISMENSSMKNVLCIKVCGGESSLLFPMERIEAVLMSPVIVKVPEAPEGLIGLSPYRKCIVPYFRMSEEPAGQETADGIRRDVRCGILLRSENGLIGIGADEIAGETEISADKLKKQMPVHLVELLGGI